MWEQREHPQEGNHAQLGRQWNFEEAKSEPGRSSWERRPGLGMTTHSETNRVPGEWE